MFFLWLSISLLLITKFCTSQPLCIDSCKFNHNFDDTLVLPSNCTIQQRDQCATILIFDYSNRIVNIQFGSYSNRQQRSNIIYTTELITDTIITLDGESSAQNVVEYYCREGDRCEYEYIVNNILPFYIHKTCHRLRVQLIARLHGDPSSTSRTCVINGDSDTSTCGQPCELFFNNPNETLRRCDSPKDLQFQTTVGQTTPINKPEYNYRLYSYTCTTDLCNSYAKQQEIERLIKSDDGECLVFLENINQTSTTTIVPYSQGSFNSNFLLLIIFYLLTMKYLIF
ncbi:hypothetical protein I4U23_026074 [Adineta vaga]|nr:hypothetical protein I4U23_026074 [Adineta vaga]